MRPTIVALTVASLVLKAWLTAAIFAGASVIAARVMLTDKGSLIYRTGREGAAALRALTRRS